ncbi:exported hypothetical protein [Carnobacterium maltaromaticum]|uniref:BspA family leucine-rich repeat surface protein n=1 Tax=Carnobacterium maltaromaticum TaxID=2751 RepID=UPI00191BADB9|nr:BspA family leucine-rich repeat surface protein [Carnobacterium maltaromaticum]CAD5902636.1 exported hypothetical protein [Carnobacterium maltaromaticum]
MKKRISLIMIFLVLPVFIGTATSHYHSEKVEATKEDQVRNPEESMNVRNSVDNYSKEMVNETNNIIGDEGVMTNESEFFSTASDEIVRELEEPIASGLYGTSSWELFSDGSLYIGAGEFPFEWSDPGWLYRNIKSIIIEGPIVAGEKFSEFSDIDKSGIFNNSSLESITGLSYLDTSNVTSMSFMFSGSKLSELDVSGFDTSNVINMSTMFSKMNQLSSLDLSGFDTSNVTDMSFMFARNQLNELDISGFDTSNVTTMAFMFSDMNQLSSLDLSGFDTSNVKTMAFMFGLNQLNELDVSGFDTSNVTAMTHMFAGNQLSELDVSGFDTSNVTDMSFMFAWTPLSELDVSGFDTSNVTDTDGTFDNMEQLRTLVLGTKSIWSESTRLPESVSEGYWIGEETGTIFNSSSDFMRNYTGEFPDVYTREQEFLFDFSADEENSVATITGYIGSKTEIDIPNIAINYSMGWTREIPVVSVENRAFYEKKLNSVTFPASIETIGTEAFAHNNIEAVEFPEELTSIGESAFQINSLIELNIPDKVYEIGNRAFAENSSLSQVTLGDGIEKIGSGMFISAPLKTIEVSEEYLEKYRALLNIDVMVAAVVESPVLQVFGEDRYIDGTNLEMNLDYGDVLELGVISKNRYQMGSTYVWNTFTPIVQWYKNSKALADEVNRIFTINQVQEEDSGNYHAVVEETILEPITVNVSPLINPDIPPIDPTDSNPIFPENPNPAIEALSLRFVSDIDFNEINVSNSDQRIYSKPTIDMNGQEIPNMVTVQDTRTVDKRDNWNLTVKQSGELMNGARIIMTPYSHSQNKEMFGIIISNPVLVITSDFQSFAATDNSENAGIFSLGMHETEAQGVQLEVPAKAAVGQYSTTLIWNLVSAP